MSDEKKIKTRGKRTKDLSGKGAEMERTDKKQGSSICISVEELQKGT